MWWATGSETGAAPNVLDIVALFNGSVRSSLIECVVFLLGFLVGRNCVIGAIGSVFGMVTSRTSRYMWTKPPPEFVSIWLGKLLMSPQQEYQPLMLNRCRKVFSLFLFSFPLYFSLHWMRMKFFSPIDFSENTWPGQTICWCTVQFHSWIENFYRLIVHFIKLLNWINLCCPLMDTWIRWAKTQTMADAVRVNSFSSTGFDISSDLNKIA